MAVSDAGGAAPDLLAEGLKWYSISEASIWGDKRECSDWEKQFSLQAHTVWSEKSPAPCGSGGGGIGGRDRGRESRGQRERRVRKCRQSVLSRWQGNTLLLLQQWQQGWGS
ncbi:hypothetical protein BGW80DRAFT_1247047 [Lactifluus volemus]|nr:hypothetical protein BGW80DRAFT_1247047 [Lactifluus volemus]